MTQVVTVSDPATTAPPRRDRSPARWARKHLFRNARDSVITVVLGAFVAFVLYRTFLFVFVTGRWEIVRVNLGLFLYGRYPPGELWRVAVAVAVFALQVGLLGGMIAQRRRVKPTLTWQQRVADLWRRWWPLLVLTGVLLVLSSTIGPWITAIGAAVAGVVGYLVGRIVPRNLHRWLVVANIVLPIVMLSFLASPLGWDDWGGLMLTLYLAAAGMVLSFPFGVLLALGRRSSLPALRLLSVGFIEVVRGVPLVVLILMADQALGFFFPRDVLPGKVVRVIIVLTIFTAAYVAEIVRGGLQSVGRGQTEAGQAVGLTPVRITALIVLPQALRAVIPALVGQFISLFKDTTLVFIIGLLDVLSVADGVTKQPAFVGQGLFAETFVFAGLLFWAGSYTLSRESRRLERRLGVGTR